MEEYEKRLLEVERRIKNLEKIRLYEDFPSYHDWLERKTEQGAKIHDVVKNSLNTSGIPLELETETVLKKLGFTFSDFNYDITTTAGEVFSKQLDIHATKTEKVEVEQVPIYFVIHLIGDCKSSELIDLLAFSKNSEEESPDNFPILLNGKQLGVYPLKKFAKFPVITDKLAEITLPKDRIAKGEMTIKVRRIDKFYGYLEQVTEGLTSFVERRRQLTRDVYLTAMQSSALCREYRNYLDTNDDARLKLQGDRPIDTSKLDKFLQTYESKHTLKYPVKYSVNNSVKEATVGINFNREVRYLEINIVIPIIVVSKERGVIKAVYNEDKGEVIKLEDAGFILIEHGTAQPIKSSYVELKNLYKVPIVICNLDYLPQLITMLTEGVNALKTLVTNQVSQDPKKLLREIILYTLGGSSYR